LARGGIEHGREFELRGGPDAVLLLHGLTGSTFEMHVVARRLGEAGMRCLAPMMAGHGGDARDLLGVPWPEWVAKARRELARLEGARRRFVVGCSMGALVACALAHDHPERVDGLVLLAPALELQLHGRLGALLGNLGPLSRIVVPKRAGSDVRDPEMRERNRDSTLEGVPLVAGAHDHTVTLGGARRLARRIGSGPAELVVLEDSWHLVGIDVERDLCADVAARFLSGLPVPGARTATQGRRSRGEGRAAAKKRSGGGTKRRGQGRRPRAR
jgi:carboxylesterase